MGRCKTDITIFRRAKVGVSQNKRAVLDGAGKLLRTPMKWTFNGRGDNDTNDALNNKYLVIEVEIDTSDKAYTLIKT